MAGWLTALPDGRMDGRTDSQREKEGRRPPHTRIRTATFVSGAGEERKGKKKPFTSDVSSSYSQDRRTILTSSPRSPSFPSLSCPLSSFTASSYSVSFFPSSDSDFLHGRRLRRCCMRASEEEKAA